MSRALIRPWLARSRALMRLHTHTRSRDALETLPRSQRACASKTRARDPETCIMRELSALTEKLQKIPGQLGSQKGRPVYRPPAPQDLGA